MLRPLLALVALAVCSWAEDSENKGPIDTFSTDERAKIEASSETHKFEAEVSRLMDIIIHSLYSNRDIFLRELISNAADATDKVRFLALTDSSLLADNEELNIEIVADNDAKTLTLTDKGIGMTKQDLLKNLGIVAKSGTTEFLEAAAKGGDALGLIGQFGVGFYSVYLVADKVTVASKNDDDPDQHIWESTANTEFTVAKDPRGNTLGRGTSITLYMKEDAAEFLSNSKLEEIVQRYSQFVDLPIMLQETKTVDEEVPLSVDELEAEEEKAAAKEESEDSEDLEVTEEEDEDAKEEEKPKIKTVKKEVKEFKRLNKLQPVWTRDPSDVTEEEYNEFYKSLDGVRGKPLEKVHFSADGAEVSFKALLYIQDQGSSGRFNTMFKNKKSGVKLYVRKVLISDEFDEFLPNWMDTFVKGVVDSEDLPLNVSRETLAQSRVLKVIAKKLQRKILDVLRKLAEGDSKDDEVAEETEEVEEAADVETKDEDKKEEESAYDKFWKNHGQSIKYGVIEDRKNKAKLSKLLRYQTSKSNEKFVSLESYVENMPEDQNKIYYFNCENLDKCAASPFVEKVIKKGYEVVWMTDVIDEYVTQHMTEFDGVELQNVVRENMNLDKDEKKAFKQLKEEFKPVVEFLKQTYGSRVSSVKVSNKLDQSPCVVTSASYGWSANMERIMKAQTMSTGGGFSSPKTLEINPRHPIMRAIKDQFEVDAEKVENLAQLLLDGALVNSGFVIDDVGQFGKRMKNVVTSSLGVDSELTVEEETEDPPSSEEEEVEEEEEEVEELEEEPEHTEL